MGIFISFPTIKNKEICPDLVACTAIAEGNLEWVELFRESEVKRKEGYKDLKETFKNAMLEKVLTLFPELKDKVDYVELGTPLSNENYLGRFASYGAELSNERMFDTNYHLVSKTKV